MRVIAGLASTLTVALLIALSLSSSGAVRTGHGRASVTIDNPANIHIDNFGRADPNYYRGARPEGHSYADLAALGVKTVIDLTSYDADPNEQALTEQAGMRYVQIPMTTHRPPTVAQLVRFLDIVNDPAHQPVYVHCVQGRHRTGVMTAIYRMTDDGWTADQAFNEMKQYGFGADILHAEFKQFVYGYRPESLPVR